jgi:hypothetical protein
VRALELSHRFSAALPRRRPVVSPLDLFLRRSRREQVGARLNRRRVIRHDRDRILEQHCAASSGPVQRGEREHVLLPRVANSSEPDAIVIALDERADRWFLALTGVGVLRSLNTAPTPLPQM